MARCGAMTLAREAPQTLPIRDVCLSLDVPRSSFYYALVTPSPATLTVSLPTQAPQNVLSAVERENVHPLRGVFLAVVNSERFCNDSPRVIVARLADEDQQYLCSPSTIYRILKVENLVHERRAHPRRTGAYVSIRPMSNQCSWLKESTTPRREAPLCWGVASKSGAGISPSCAVHKNIYFTTPM